jgi:hypothetical protein
MTTELINAVRRAIKLAELSADTMDSPAQALADLRAIVRDLTPAYHNAVIQVIDDDAHSNAEPDFLAAVIDRAKRDAINAREIKIYVSPRVPDDAPIWRNPGWLEYGINIEWNTGGRLYIGAIQRTRGAPIEYHS